MPFTMSPPAAQLIVPRDKTLVTGPDLWSGVRSGCWTFDGGGDREFVPDIARGGSYGLMPQALATKLTGKLGPGLNVGSTTGTGDIWEYGLRSLSGTAFYDSTNFLRPTASIIDAQGFYIEVLAELFTAPAGQSGIWTNARKTASSYEGIDLSVDPTTNRPFMNFGDSDSTSSTNRRSCSCNEAMPVGEPCLIQFATDDNFTQTNWHMGVNGVYGESFSGTASDVPEYDTVFSTTMHIMVGGRNRPFVTDNFPGVIYGFNVIYRDFSPAQMLERYRRFWEMFTPARTRELAPSGFLNLRNTGPAPQAQSLS